ncbi:VOC family protein [Halobellus sp. GM3]|uniref:VOC family protein n=1 Tax=Halobellus sp. GM3 TaxID=3458410 RepID=UPI00403DD556
MADLQRIEHASVHVEDLEEATEFYTDAMGLVEVARENGTVYLGTGLTENFELAVTEGGTGIEHFAVRADSADLVDEYEGELGARGVETERVDGDEPGQEAGVRFEMPSGVPMEIVTVADEDYPHGNISLPSRAGQAPSSIDHVQFFTPDIDADLGFLRDTIGMAVSDIAGPMDDLEVAFARCNTLHHDVALKQMPEGGPDHTSLHHVAWGFDDIGHLKLFLDTVSGRGMDFERGIGRHYAGNNLYAYIWEPGGNRFELCAEMAVVKTDEPDHAEDYLSATTAWGPDPPASFDEGSGLVQK